MARSATRRTTSLTALGALLLLALSFGTAAADWPCNIGDGSPDLIVVYFDIIPQTCPNVFQLSPPMPLQGELTGAVCGDEGFDVNLINSSSMLLTIPGGGFENPCGQVPPLWTQPGDVATPYTGTDSCGCVSAGPDAWVDLQMGFDKEEVEEALGSVQPGEEVKIYITGSLIDGTPFVGLDCLLIRGPTAVEPSPWGTVKSEYR